MPPSAASSSHAPHPSASPSPLLRRRHHDQARLRALSATLRLRLAYAQLKVAHGWHTLTIDEVEALYRLRRRARLADCPVDATAGETSETEWSKDSEGGCGSTGSTASTSLTTPDADVCSGAPAGCASPLGDPQTVDLACAGGACGGSPGPGAAAVWPALGALTGADEDEAWGGLGALVGWPAVGGPGEDFLASMNTISPVQSRSLPRVTTLDLTPCRPSSNCFRTPVSRLGAPSNTPAQLSATKQLLGSSCGRSRLSHHQSAGLNGSVFDDGVEISLDDLDGMNWT